MIPPQSFATLERLVSLLPFELTDIDRANELFELWCISSHPEEKKIVDLWTYCYVWRNILVKFTRNPDLNPADFDMLVARIFEKVLDRRHTVQKHNRYSNWISVVCRNTFINYARARKKDIHYEEERGADWCVSEPGETAGDTLLLLEVVNRAIDRLPRHLRDVTRMRLLDELPYEEISKHTGQRIDVIRSYVNKAVHRLREDRLLHIFIRKEFREDLKNQGMN